MYHEQVACTGAIVAGQARKVCALYPELFAALDARDAAIRRIVVPLPNRHDPASARAIDFYEAVVVPLSHLPPGIRAIAEEQG